MHTLDLLIAEAERIAKPSLLLTEEPANTGIIAYWGGNGSPSDRSPNARPGDSHRITLDTKWLAAQGIKIDGALSVFEVDCSWNRPLPIQLNNHPGVSLSTLSITDGIPLYGHETMSLPPLQALCLYGGPSIESWLRSHALERWQYYAIEGDKLAREYQAEYQRRSPLYLSSASAVMGGWHAIWPDDDFYLPREMQLLVWTLRDAEPWIEVFKCGINFVARHRIT